jgi:hypothetical protein
LISLQHTTNMISLPNAKNMMWSVLWFLHNILQIWCDLLLAFSSTCSEFGEISYRTCPLWFTDGRIQRRYWTIWTNYKYDDNMLWWDILHNMLQSCGGYLLDMYTTGYKYGQVRFWTFAQIGDSDISITSNKAINEQEVLFLSICEISFKNVWRLCCLTSPQHVTNIYVDFLSEIFDPVKHCGFQENFKGTVSSGQVL